jgi:hypothetical protein
MGVNALGKIKAFIIISDPGANDANPSIFHIAQDGVLLLGRQSVRLVYKVYADHYVLGPRRSLEQRHE